MAADYIPRNEEDFNEWQVNFMEVLTPAAPGWNVPPAVVTGLTTRQTDWTPKYAAGRDEADPKPSQRVAKNDSRKLYIKAIRKAVKEALAFNPVVTNENRQTLGITIPDTERTRVAVPDRAPTVVIDKLAHLSHKLRITDPLNPGSKKKPAGVTRINVYRFVGTTAPASVGQYTLMGSSTKFLFTSSFVQEDMTKTAWYIGQYENTRGERGPVSDAVSGVVA